MTIDPTSSGLSDPEQSATVPGPDVNALRQADGEIDIRKLAAALRKDRIRRKLTWPKYADYIGVPMSTIYKIAQQGSKPHELTVQTILDKWASESTNDDGGSAAREVVPGR